jgi:glycosyltransferase involved in cell wall biosynthesis
MRNILVYRTELLPLSETFVRAQAIAMHRYRPHFMGLYATKPSLVGPKECWLLESSSYLPRCLRRSLYQWFGVQALLHTTHVHQRLQTLHPTLIHAHFAIDAAAILPFAKRFNLPLIVTLHGYDVTASRNFRNPLRGWLQRRQLHALWQGAAQFLCVSEFIRQKALSAGFPGNKLIVHRIGVDTTRFRPPIERAHSNDIVFVGRLTEKKGCEILISAMEQVNRILPEARLLILGHGPLQAQLQGLAAQLKVNCAFLGRQSHDQVRQTLENARICVVPSVTAANGDSEGLPMILIEAQALGVPVVATRHAGIPEGIVDGNAGMLSDERDIHGLADNIVRLFADRALHEDLSRRGVDLVRHNFDLHRQTDQLETIYDRVLNVPSAHPKSSLSALAAL